MSAEGRNRGREGKRGWRRERSEGRLLGQLRERKEKLPTSPSARRGLVSIAPPMPPLWQGQFMSWRSPVPREAWAQAGAERIPEPHSPRVQNGAHVPTFFLLSELSFGRLKGLREGARR